MSVLNQYPEVINNKDLQIWNNSAFDDGGEPETFNSCSNPIKKPVSCDSLDSSFSSKENQSPIGYSKPKSSVLVNPLHESKLFNNCSVKIGSLKPSVEDGDKTDEEIEIENEIRRLVAKLESIRAEKKNVKVVENEKQVKLVVNNKKIQESSFSGNKIPRRGFSLGPNEIMSATGLGLKSKQSGIGTGTGTGTTPMTQNRRKSCFWKLDDIEEEKCRVSRGKNYTSSMRQAVTTVGSRKTMKKDDSILGSIQPKKLFGDQSVPAKKPAKPGRVVPSRYNQATVNSSMKKKSLTENVDRKPRGGTEGRVKKKWDIPSVIVIPKRLNLDDNLDECENENVNEECVDVVKPEVLLPRIRVVRYVEEAGRDSGPAKRVAELVGKKSYFDEATDCQKLSFDED